MKEFLKKNFIIILAFALPLILIIIVALSIYLPSFFLSTKYNFIYTSCTEGTNYSYCSGNLPKNYSVIGGKLIISTSTPRIFLHDTEKNESREISIEEARALTLNDLLTSPDGVTVSSNYDRGFGFLFFGTDSSYGLYLTKGDSSSKLNLISQNERYYYPSNFQFIGWILPGRN